MPTPTLAYTSLLEHLSKLNDKSEIEAVLTALLTDKEQQDIANRILIFDRLDKGVTQRAISQELGVGIATVSRGARAMRQQNSQTINNTTNHAIDNLLATHRKLH